MRKPIEAKIDALPDAYRPVFMLRAVEEFSVEETADIARCDRIVANVLERIGQLTRA